MKPDLDRVATQLERTATLLRTRGKDAFRLTQDWATPLRSPSGPAPKGQVSNPTLTAAIQQTPEQQRISLAHALMRQELDVVYDNAASLAARIVWATEASTLAENKRAGIGWCTTNCNTYCDGKERRLRNGVCPACTQRETRKKAKAG